MNGYLLTAEMNEGQYLMDPQKALLSCHFERSEKS